MHEYLGSFIQNQSQTVHKNFINLKNPKFFSKTQNLDLNAWRMRDKEIIPSDLRQEKAENHTWTFKECVKHLWTFRPPIHKLPAQAYNQTMYVWNMKIS